MSGEQRLLAGAAACVAVVAVLGVAYPHRPLAPLDDTVARRAADLPHVLVELAKPVTWGGSAVGLTLVALLAAAVLLQRRHVAIVAVLPLLAYGCAQGVTLVVKALVDRPRPDVAPAIPIPSSAAFPSGHASTSLAVLTVVAALAGGGRKAIAAALVGALAVGASRVVLGVHWTTDVLAGWALGGACACLLLVLRGRLRGPAPDTSPRCRRAGRSLGRSHRESII